MWLKIEPRPFWPRRGFYNRLWRPSLFMDDDALLVKPSSSWINDPWWHKYPELRPLDLATTSCRPPTNLRTSYLSPVKRTYVWGYHKHGHPLRPFGKSTIFLVCSPIRNFNNLPLKVFTATFEFFPFFALEPVSSLLGLGPFLLDSVSFHNIYQSGCVGLLVYIIANVNICVDFSEHL